MSSIHGQPSVIKLAPTAFVISVTESPALGVVDFKQILCYMVRWSSTISHAGMKSLSAIPNTACIYWMEIPAGIWQDLYGSPGVIFSLSFNLSDREIIRGGVKIFAKEQARLHRFDHLVENVGQLPKEPRVKSNESDPRNVRWGQCAETLALTG